MTEGLLTTTTTPDCTCSSGILGFRVHRPGCATTLPTDLPEHWREPYAAWLSNGYDDDLTEFEDAYAGEWDSEREYAESLADDLGLVPSDYSWPTSYIDWDAATRDLFISDYWSTPAPRSGVYVFRSF